jgi:hypothetical protein
MVVVATGMGPTTVTAIILVEHRIWVVVNPHHTTKVIIHIGMNLTQHGELGAMDPNMVIGVLEDVKES